MRLYVGSYVYSSYGAYTANGKYAAYFDFTRLHLFNLKVRLVLFAYIQSVLNKYNNFF